MAMRYSLYFHLHQIVKLKKTHTMDSLAWLVRPSAVKLYHNPQTPNTAVELHSLQRIPPWIHISFHIIINGSMKQ